MLTVPSRRARKKTFHRQTALSLGGKNTEIGSLTVCNRFRSIRDWSETPRNLAATWVNFEYNPNVAPTEMVPGVSVGVGAGRTTRLMRFGINFPEKDGRKSETGSAQQRHSGSWLRYREIGTRWCRISAEEILAQFCGIDAVQNGIPRAMLRGINKSL